MARERWGTFSVKDHTRPHPFAVDVLLYDRLIIPEPADATERAWWAAEAWDPDRLDKVLEILGTDDKGHALTVSWNTYTKELFNQRMQTASVVGEEVAYLTTAQLLATEFRPKGPDGVVPVSVVAAYESEVGAAEGWHSNDPLSVETLTLAIAHEFIVLDHAGRDDLELLQDAVGLAGSDDFKKKRMKLYEWQQGVLQAGLTQAEAIREMTDYVSDYNRAVRKADQAVFTKFAFTLIPISLAAVGGPIGAIAGLGALSNLVKFWIYDRKPVVKAEDSQPAAMLHSIHNDLGWSKRVGV